MVRAGPVGLAPVGAERVAPTSCVKSRRSTRWSGGVKTSEPAFSMSGRAPG